MTSCSHDESPRRLARTFIPDVNQVINSPFDDPCFCAYVLATYNPVRAGELDYWCSFDVMHRASSPRVSCSRRRSSGVVDGGTELRRVVYFEAAPQSITGV